MQRVSARDDSVWSVLSSTSSSSLMADERGFRSAPCLCLFFLNRKGAELAASLDRPASEMAAAAGRSIDAVTVCAAIPTASAMLCSKPNAHESHEPRRMCRSVGQSQAAVLTFGGSLRGPLHSTAASHGGAQYGTATALSPPQPRCVCRSRPRPRRDITQPLPHIKFPPLCTLTVQSIRCVEQVQL